MNQERSLTHRPATLGKSCKLRHRSLVEPLFSHANSVYEYPLRAVWRTLTEEELSATFCNHVPDRIGKVQLLITVPKKKRRHAVDRVYVRRRIREGFRLSRRAIEQTLSEQYPEIRTLSIAFLYQAPENFSYEKISKGVERILAKILRKLENKGKTDKNEKTGQGAEQNSGRSVMKNEEPDKKTIKEGVDAKNPK